MKSLIFNHRHTARISSDELIATALTIEPEVVTVGDALEKGFTTEYASCVLPRDVQLLERVQAVIEEKKRFNPVALVVVGIGGSHLGAQAVLEALYGRYYNEQGPSCKMYFVDTFDTDASFDVYLLVEELLQENKTVLINVVSKTGATLETQANAALFVDLIKRYRPYDYKDLLIITTDHESALWRSAQRDGFSCLEIPQLVGGRYSVLSAVGLFPLGIVGVDIEALRNGAAAMLDLCTQTDVENNPAALSAALLDLHYYRGIAVHDTFLFSKDLTALGAWYRQLTGESLGKMYDRAGGLVRIGMVPTVSIGSSDLHSVGQLYLAGPRNRFTSFVTVEKQRSDCVVPNEESMLHGALHNASFAVLMEACAKGTMIAYQKQELPFVHIELPEKSAWSIGQFLQFKMVETIYFGYLLDVNPFDQPQVELYKQEMRKLLNHE